MYLKTEEIAERLAVVPNTIKALNQVGELLAIRVGKQYRVLRDEYGEGPN